MVVYNTAVFIRAVSSGYKITGTLVRAYSMRPNMAEGIVITSPAFRSLLSREHGGPQLLKLASIFDEDGFEIRIAGGAVRDILTNKPPKDVDLATTATPAQMKEMFEKRQIRTINANGEKHGTVTARIGVDFENGTPDERNFEVTTLRVDKNHDGRWAEVEFTQDWVLDAGRRDLTINAMFLGLDGKLYDYFNGAEDLRNHRIRFVGDAAQRIQEDYLRILRYFRFYGRISDLPDAHNPDTIQAIKDNLEGLRRISGERLWTEFRQIAVGRNASAVIDRMWHVGIATYLGFPEMEDRTELFAVWKRAHDLNPEPMTIISTLIHANDIENLHSRLKLSNFEKDLAYFITRNRSNPDVLDAGKQINGNVIRPYQQLMAKEIMGEYDPDGKYRNCSASEAKNRVIELIKYRGDRIILETFKNWEYPRFPVGGQDMLEKAVEKGRFTGLVLRALQKIWIESDFTETKESLLEQRLPSVMDQVRAQKAALDEQHKNKRMRKS